MRKFILPFFLGVCLLLLFTCSRTTPQNEPPPVVSQPPPTGLPMPPINGAKADLGWVIADTQHVRLSDLRDKVVILDFYATWCVPCRESIPHLIELHKRYSGKGLEIVGLNVGGPEDYEEVPAFARSFGITYQLGIPDPELEQLFMSDERAIPQTFILDRKGAIIKRFIGYDDSLGEELDSVVQSSLAKAD
jgi:cytochrome c biogenesis protein CcmG, thiol:disulfide interchange protein DsbE